MKKTIIALVIIVVVTACLYQANRVYVQKQIKDCVKEAADKQRELWNDNCELYKKEDGCSLPSDRAEILMKHANEQKDYCVKLYK